jgi:predicted transcriptional regulator
MACINPDGTITPTAKVVLQALQVSMTAQELSENLKIPLFRIRGSIREMVEAGLVKAEGDAYIITDQGRARIGSS